jgi:hypothetical protein
MINMPSGHGSAVIMRKNASGCWEFESDQEYRTHLENDEEIRRTLSETIIHFNALEKMHIDLNRSHYDLSTKNNMAMLDFMAMASRQHNVIERLRRENAELRRELGNARWKRIARHEPATRVSRARVGVTYMSMKRGVMIRNRRLWGKVKAREHND